MTRLGMRHAALVMEHLAMSIGNTVIEMNSALREAISEVDQDSCVRDTVKGVPASSSACLYLLLAKSVG